MTDIIQFKGNIIIKGKIECLTGLHIGGSKEKLEIGGVDSPVIRHPNSKYPYIPGSSIKGKMRHLLEFSTGAVTDYVGDKLGNVSKSEKIVRIFGIGADDVNKPKNEPSNENEVQVDGEADKVPEKHIGPGRLIVRDCKPDSETVEMWENMDSELLYTEYKPENTIDRLTSEANPRFIERVVQGSKFDFEMIYGVYQMSSNQVDEEKASNEDLKNILWALRLLEDSTLGKSGSRGYGQIKFQLTDPIFVPVEDYQSGDGQYQKANEAMDETELKSLDNIKLQYKETQEL